MLPLCSLEDILNFPHIELKKTTEQILEVWARLKKHHLTEEELIDYKTLSLLLPLPSAISNIICESDLSHIAWRPRIAAIIILSIGTPDQKLSAIRSLYGLQNGDSRTLVPLLTEIVSLARQLSDSLTAEVNGVLDETSQSVVNSSWSTNQNNENRGFQVEDDNHDGSVSLTGRLNMRWSAMSSPVEISSRAKHACCYHRSKLYILGGRDGRYPVKDFWCYNLETESWLEIKPKGERLPHLEEHTMVPYEDSIYIFGGVSRLPCDDGTPLWVFNTVTEVCHLWTCGSEVMLPPCLKGHSSVRYGSAMHTFGGNVDVMGSSDCIWTFDMGCEQWQLSYCQRMGKVGPSARYNHTATVHSGNMYVIGGISTLQACTDMWRWNIATRIWSKVKTTTAAPAVFGHSAVNLGASIYIIGGENMQGLLKHCWQFNTKTNSWHIKDTLTDLLPSPRCQHTAVLAPPQKIPARSRSMPLRSRKRVQERRPRTSPSSHQVHHFAEAHQTDRNRVWPLEEDVSTLLSCDTTIKQPGNYCDWTGDKRVSSTDTIILPVSDLNSLLCNRSSLYSECSEMFDNPAFVRSLDELSTTKVPLGAGCHADRIRPYSLSRSLDSIQDYVSEIERLLPGSVISQSEESHLDTCTVRNVIMDEVSLAGDGDSDTEDDLFSLPSETSQDFSLFVFGGKQKNRMIAGPSPLAAWKCVITSF